MNTTILDELYCVLFSGGREPNHRSPLISLCVAKNWTTSTVYLMVYVKEYRAQLVLIVPETMEINLIDCSTDTVTQEHWG